MQYSDHHPKHELSLFLSVGVEKGKKISTWLSFLPLPSASIYFSFLDFLHILGLVACTAM